MPSTEEGALRLKCLDVGTDGALKVKFDLGSFDHPIYGTSGNLCGEYELFHTRCLYPVSNYFTLSKEEQRSLHQKAIKQHRDLFENLDDDDLALTMLHAIGATAVCCPRYDVNSDDFEISIGQMALSYRVDDAGEENLLSQKIPEIYQQLKPEFVKYEANGRHWHDLVNDSQAWSEAKARGIKIHPEAENALTTSQGLYEMVKAKYDGTMPRTVKIVSAAGVNSVEGGVLGYRGEGPLAYSERQLARVRSYEAGMEVYQEFTALLQKFVIPKYIRKTLLFGLLVEGVRDFGSYTNDLIGLLKDVNEEATNKNVILRKVVREGISLDESFRMVLKDLQDTVHDMKVTIQLLLESFPDEDALIGYINAAKDLCDGQTIGYVLASQHKGRYGAFPITIEPSTKSQKQA